MVAALALGLAACGGADQAEDGAAEANGAGDPFGATGAPGADMTDNGAGDGANGLADGNAS